MTTRAAIYARYSSDRQSAASIEDQLRLCRARLEAEGWEPAGSFSDAAISGAAANRPGLQALLAAAEAGRLDLVLVEALDRLSRGQAGVAALFERLSHLEVRIVSLAEGEIGALHIGLKGTMNALYLVDLAQKTRRGLAGRVAAGRSGGGLCYGYRVVEGAERGLREIEPAEAAVVRRIFADYVAGRSPRAIAAALNAEGVPSPHAGRRARGEEAGTADRESKGAWRASSINGNRRRGLGILNNQLYRGRLVWNRQRFVKDPASGRRQARPNPESAWQVAEAPELRIVPEDLWTAKEAVQAAIEAVPRGRSRRPRRLLSGLLHCHACGGPLAIAGTARYACSAQREKGTCGERRSIAAAKVERRALDGLKEKLLTPEAMGAAVKAFHLELQRASRARAAAQQDAARELAKVDRALAGVLEAVKDGLYHPDMKGETARLRARKAALEAAREPASAVIDFHPGLPEIYRRRLEDLQDALAGDAESRAAAVAILRQLIDRIVVVFGEERGAFQLQIEGRLAAILGLAHHSETSVGKVVAGARFIPTHTSAESAEPLYRITA